LISREPISTRRGMPFLIHSQPLAPPMSRGSISTVIGRSLYRQAFSFPRQAFRIGHHGLAFLLFFKNGQQHDLRRGHARRQDDAVIITVGHDHPSDQAGGRAPGGGPDVFLVLLGRLKLDSGGRAKFWPRKWEVPAEAPCVLHHGLDAEGVDRSRKPLGRGLAALEDRHRQVLLGHTGIDVEHHHGALPGLLPAGMRRMAFLPQKLTGAQKDRVRISQRTTLPH